VNTIEAALDPVVDLSQEILLRSEPEVPVTTERREPMLREAELARTFIEVADTLVDDFDVIDLLTLVADRCVEVLGVDAAGLMVAAEDDGELRVVASSSETMRVLELFELQAEEGPCPECYRTGLAVVDHPLLADDDRWPMFSPRAIEAGFQTVYAFPMRLRNKVIGAVNLFCAGPGGLSAVDVSAAQAFADIATIAILQQRAVADAQTINAQLTTALNSRVVVEQAKGIVAERSAVPMERAFALLRSHARNRNLRLDDVARNIIDGTLRLDVVDHGHHGVGGR
jgi:GAF domain-containing protein